MCDPVSKKWTISMPVKPLFFKYQILYLYKVCPVWADENQQKYEKSVFFLEKEWQQFNL